MKKWSQCGALALLAMLGTLLVFFFPAPCGPFSVTNGPVTAFRALTAATRVFAAMGAALLLASLLRCILVLESMAQIAVRISFDPDLFVLRC
jgi:hypothetical protein